MLPASADDGDIPRATLNLLGLNKIQMMSVKESMRVRGQSATAYGTNSTLATPFAKSIIKKNSRQSRIGTEESIDLNRLLQLPLTLQYLFTRVINGRD